MGPFAAVLNLLQVAGGVVILYAIGPPYKDEVLRADVRSQAFNNALLALALLSVLSWLLIQLMKGIFGLMCQAELRKDAIMEVIARCALAFGWAVMAIAMTMSFNQADISDRATHSPSSSPSHLGQGHGTDFAHLQTTAGFSRSSIEPQSTQGRTHTSSLKGGLTSFLNEGLTSDAGRHQALIVIWIMAAIAAAIALLTSVTCCMLCCCCCCNADALCFWAPCAALCCVGCCDGRGDNGCCSPFWCAEVLCLGWLVRKFMQPSDPYYEHCCHTHHVCHPPMPPPPPPHQIRVVEGRDYGLHEPLLAGNQTGGAPASAWRGPTAAAPAYYGDPYYQPPVIHPSGADLMRHQRGSSSAHGSGALVTAQAQQQQQQQKGYAVTKGNKGGIGMGEE